MNRTKDNILGHDGDALLSEKNIRPFEFLKNLSESDSIRPCLVTDSIQCQNFHNFLSLLNNHEKKKGRR